MNAATRESTQVDSSLWSRCVRALEGELPEKLFNTWVRPLQAVESSGALKLLAPNRFAVDWFGRLSEAKPAAATLPQPAPQAATATAAESASVPISFPLVRLPYRPAVRSSMRLPPRAPFEIPGPPIVVPPPFSP